MIFLKNKLLLFLLIIVLISCQTQIQYRTVPLTTPPEKYFISDYKTKKELYFEYQHALMTIKEWQLWYNVNARSNYFDYTKEEISNYYYNNTNNVSTNSIK